MADETPSISALTTDRGRPIGNSLGDDNRGRAHVKVANTGSEPVPVTDAFPTSFWNVKGANPEVDSSLDELVIDQGGNIYAYPTSAVTLSAVSSNANDTSAGSGARSIVIEGLVDNGGSWDMDTETIAMNGTTPVNTTKSFIRFLNAYVLTAGSSAQNQGIIDISNGGNILGEIRTGENETFLGMFTIPSGYQGRIKRIGASILPTLNASGIKEGALTVLWRSNGFVFRPLSSRIAINSRGDTKSNLEFDSPMILSAKTDIQTRFTAYNNNTRVFLNFSVLLEAV